jgi:hypothetical protein
VLLPTADTDGDWEEMPWLAGQGVGLIHDIRPAEDVVETPLEPGIGIACRGKSCAIFERTKVEARKR